MTLYQFHFFDLRGETPTLDIAYHPDDATAWEAAERLLGQHRSAVGVDIYDVDRLVDRIERQIDDELKRA
jgi:hypothetical protein